MGDVDSPPADRSDDSADEIPGRAADRPLYKKLLVAAVFVAWLGVLLLVKWLGRP